MPGSDERVPVSRPFRVLGAAEAWAAQLNSDDWTVDDEGPAASADAQQTAAPDLPAADETGSVPHEVPLPPAPPSWDTTAPRA